MPLYQEYRYQAQAQKNMAAAITESEKNNRLKKIHLKAQKLAI